MYLSLGPGEMHPRVLREFTDGVTLMMFKKSWQSGEVPVDQKKGNVPIFRRGRKENPLGTTNLSNSPLCLGR